MADIATLAEVKAQLNKTDSADDAELATYISAATRYVEWRLGGPVAPTSYTERHYLLGEAIIPRRRPLVSVTSLTSELGACAIDAAAYVADTGLGQVTLLRSLPYGWYTLVYTAGATPSASAKLAGLIVAQHLWQTQQGSGGRPYPADDVVMTGLGFAVPRRAEELLAGEQISGVA